MFRFHVLFLSLSHFVLAQLSVHTDGLSSFHTPSSAPYDTNLPTQLNNWRSHDTYHTLPALLVLLFHGSGKTFQQSLPSKSYSFFEELKSHLLSEISHIRLNSLLLVLCSHSPYSQPLVLHLKFWMFLSLLLDGEMLEVRHPILLT